MDDTKEYVAELFENRRLFEKDVLNVVGDKDRAEITHILITTMINDLLKEHINFLYVKSFEDFSLKQIVNIFFREIASEWVDYAISELKFSKQEALEELKEQHRIMFIKQISQDYYKFFNTYIFEKIVDTFLALLVKNAFSDSHSVLINAVINSDYIPNRSIIGVNSSDQLCECAKEAQRLKDEKISELQSKLELMRTKINSQQIDSSKREALLLAYPTYEKKLKEVEDKKLESFNDVLQRFKRTFVQTLKDKE